MRQTLDQSPLRLASLAERLDGEGLSDPTSLRARLVPELRSILDEGRAEAEAALLREERRPRLRAPPLRSHGRHRPRPARQRSCGTSTRPTTRPRPSSSPSSPTGGYGRGTLAPGSDVDLLFLLPYKQTAWGESVVEAMLYVLWDLKLKVGHATRSVDDCIREAKADMTIRTALLEARFLFGDPALYDALLAALRQGGGARQRRPSSSTRSSRSATPASPRPAPRATSSSRTSRTARAGLRDLNTLFWIAKYVYRVREPQELVEAGLFTPEELRLFERCEEFLWRVRCHMHFATGRAEERLAFDLQRQLAERIGYRPGAARFPASSAS